MQILKKISQFKKFTVNISARLCDRIMSKSTFEGLSYRNFRMRAAFYSVIRKSI
eukprot:UN07048